MFVTLSAARQVAGILAGLRAGGYGRLRAALALAATGYFAAAVTPTDFAFACCTLTGFSLLIPAAAVADIHGLPSMWRGRHLVRLGQLSFAFYMVHILILRAATHLFTIRRLTVPQAAAVAAGLAVTSLAAAWLLYEIIECPAQRLLLARRGTGTCPVRVARQRLEPLTQSGESGVCFRSGPVGAVLEVWRVGGRPRGW